MPGLKELRARLPGLTISDQVRLARRIDSATRIRPPATLRKVTAEIEAAIERADERVAARRARVPEITYPEELPISQVKDLLADAIREHQVIVVAGETGSGKTTQLPKICLEIGRGVRGLIGHTQPRRLAARSVATRIAEELGGELGDVVGFQVRFTTHVAAHSLVKLMTDGILLAELANDPLLERYDTLIIDEAHERSLNVDFILGYLRRLLPRRPDLKVIITSATIDPDRFAQHFGPVVAGDGVPVIEVSGRTYPVEVRYRPIDPGADGRDQVQAIVDAVDELSAEGPGDILVFLSGEREIRDTADALRGRHLRDTEILPLYARLSAAEQHRIFTAHPGRRIVLATNVAETSLTVPGMKYVVDPGTARISRYSNRLKVQRLPIEPISRASAKQRAGRCGRLEDGICIRLYAEDDHASRPAFTDPEILRTNLASVLLQMAALGLGDVAAFPFVDPPDRRQVKDGVDLLRELGALTEDATLTPLGRRLARLPIDPRYARVILAAHDEGCTRDVLVIAAALSIQDPRERPADAQQVADRLHARFADPSSDFISYVNLWRYLQQKQHELSASAFRRLCRTEHLNYLRVREWQDLEAQLRQAAKAVGVTTQATSAEPDPVGIHQALLTGLLSHVGRYDSEKREYAGARGARFAISPGSALFKRSPRWVMAAELVETTRLWARIVARIEPDTIERLAGHLVKRTYSEPHWDREQGAVMAYERVTLYGIPIVARRKVAYGRIDPPLSRELFIRHALVTGDWDTHHPFFHANRALLEEIEELEDRARRRDLLVDDDVLLDFYDARIPADVVSARHFDAWWKKAGRAQPDLLSFNTAMLVNESAASVSDTDFPETWPAQGVPLRLTYEFDPGAARDGVTVHIPLVLLSQVRRERFDWQVPGLRHELVTALIRSLPKSLRRVFVPVPDHARAALAAVSPDDGPLLDVLAEHLGVPRDAWDLARVPPHLRMTFRVVERDGSILAESRNLDELVETLRPRARAEVAAGVAGIERRGLRAWDVGTLPRRVDQHRDGFRITAYPALVDEKDSVSVRVFDTADEQAAAMWSGTRRLLRLQAPSPVAYVSARLSNEAKLILARNPHGSVAALLDDCAGAAADLVIAESGGPAWDEPGFARLLEQVSSELSVSTLAVLGRVHRILAAVQQVEQVLPDAPPPALAESVSDVRAQLTGLVYPGFVTATGYRRLLELPRYLRAVANRLERLPANAARDRELTARIRELHEEFERAVAELPPARRAGEDAREIRWMFEELRVSYFAQTLGTAYPISDKRVRRAVDALIDR